MPRSARSLDRCKANTAPPCPEVVFTSVQNALDQIYLVSQVPAGGRPGMPRAIQAGLRFRFRSSCQGICSMRTLVGTTPPMLIRIMSLSLAVPVYFT